jgi:MinD-like ATPase involved in chromosome partitioning or flagellar assembly
MALANIACLLAQDRDHSQRILLWDFDLEAPGVHRLFPPQQPHKYGFVDLVHNYARTGVMPDVHDYIYQSVVENVDVLPAGVVGQSYCQKLQELHWPAFFTSNPAEPGPFFGPFRKALQESKRNYDYILIDSRTGLNDQAGICTEILPDLIVILFRLTAQNIDGLQHVVPMIQFQLKARKRDNVRLLPIASVVSPTSLKETLTNREKILQLFKHKTLRYVRFDADLVTEEKLFCLQANKRKQWPLAPIVSDYQRLCDAIRQENKDDTRTLTRRIHASMEGGDYASAWPLLKRALSRRPRNAELWAILTQLSHVRSFDRKEADGLVDRLLQDEEYTSISHCYEWKAMRDVEESDAPESAALAKATNHLEKALQFGDQPVRLLRTLGMVYSCRGNLDEAVVTLKKAQEKSKLNAQINLEISFLFMRMGANYFSSSIDNVQKIITEMIDEKHLRLAYLYAFLGENQKSDAEFERFNRQTSPEMISLYRAHLLLLQGEREEALRISEPECRKHLDHSDRSNWAEFFICAEDYERAIRLLEAKKSKRSEGRLTPLHHLATYLVNSDSDMDEAKLRDAWRNMESWGFKELILFRERAKKENKIETYKRLSVIEMLLRDQELITLKEGRLTGFSFGARQSLGSLTGEAVFPHESLD